MLYFVLKLAHIVGACVLFGTGAGIAFFMLIAHRTGRVGAIAEVARIVVLADFVFTATAVVVQPITGVWLAREVGYPLASGWIVASIGLYFDTGAFWLPVVWMQVRMRNLAVVAQRDGTALPPAYYALFRWWFAFGFPAFTAVVAILWLMIARPDLPGLDGLF